MKDKRDLQARCERYRAFYAQDQENHGILCQLVDLEIQLGEFCDARKHLAEGLKKWQKDPALQFREATLELASGNPDIASTILQEMLDAGIDNPVVRYNLGYASLSLCDHERALAMFQSIEANESEIPEVPLMQSRTLHHLGDIDEAIAKADHYLSSHPDSGEALGILGLLHLDKGEYDKAKDYALKAYTTEPENREALITLGSVALEELEPSEAGDYFSKATQMYAESGRAWSGVGLTHMMANDLDQAQKALEKAVRYMPEHLGTWHALAWCQIVQGDLDAAESSLNSANEVDHNFGETYGGFAVIAALKGDWEAAGHNAKVALRLDPESFAGRFAQSLSLSRHDPLAAQALIDKLLASSPVKSGQSLQAMISTIFSKRRKKK